MSRYIVSWKIGGEAGFGIKSAGLMFAQIATRAGYEVFDYDEYPSLIRGGHNTFQATVSAAPVSSTAEQVDVLVALNKETVDRHSHELSHGAAVIYDPAGFTIPASKALHENNIKLVKVPLSQIALAAKGQQVMRNTVALGATQALLGLPLSLLSAVIKKNLAHKSQLLAANLSAASGGYEYVKKHYADIDFKINLTVKKNSQRMLITGNEAIALGALAAGVQFYAAYPMTPASSVLHFLASHASSQRVVVKHAEDEISVINMALGASHVGARAMIGTSGGGFSLMVEALGLAGITETPLVILNAQRPGPATGLPTWTEQADLRFVQYAAQGEFPRIILAPGDTDECFYLTAGAFNWADRYQMPVIILSDKFLSESHRTTPVFDLKPVTVNRHQAIMNADKLRRMKKYRRYQITDSGISPRSVPGQLGGLYLANSDEHDEYGYSNEEAANRIEQVRKRARKFQLAAAELPGPRLYGPANAKTTIVGWGSVKGPVLDAMSWLPPKLARKINFLHLNVLWPFPSEQVFKVLRRSRNVLLVENNSTAQLGQLIRQQTGVYIHHRLLKFDGRPFYPAEIKERLLSL